MKEQDLKLLLKKMKISYAKYDDASSWDWFGLVWEWASKQEWRNDFLNFCFQSSDNGEPMSSFSDEDVNGENRFYDEDYIYWLISLDRFPKLVLAFGRERLGW